MIHLATDRDSPTCGVIEECGGSRVLAKGLLPVLEIFNGSSVDQFKEWPAVRMEETVTSMVQL